MHIETDMNVTARNEKSWEVVRAVFEELEDDYDLCILSPEYDDEAMSITTAEDPLDYDEVIEIAKRIHQAMVETAEQEPDLDKKEFQVEVAGVISYINSSEECSFKVQISIDKAEIADTGFYVYVGRGYSYDEFCSIAGNTCFNIRDLLSEKDFKSDSSYYVKNDSVYPDNAPEFCESESIYDYEDESSDEDDEDEDDEEEY